MNKKNKIAGLGVISILLAVAVTLSFLGYQVLKKPVGDNKNEIIFEVEPGLSLSQISNKLQENQLIRHAQIFQWYARLRGQGTQIKVGEYSLSQSMNPDQILYLMASGKSIARTITVAEGLNIYDIALLFEKNKICSQDEFLNLVQDTTFIQIMLGEPATSLEGYLFPETYKYTKYEGVRSIVTQMVKRFQIVWNEQVGSEKNKLNWTKNQIITLASIIEKETGAAHERPIISSVFHNRLAQKMRLQTDPTVLYGMALGLKKMPNNITKKDLLNPTTYNTYTIEALPPGPIANPGLESILAVLNPAQSKFIFFVSQNNGTHVFSENLQQHNKAVQQYQMNSKAREGTSWRDLKPSDK